MKRTLILFFSFVLCFMMCGICRAEDALTESAEEVQGNEDVNLKEYITERILPVIIGVATSSFGFVAVLGTISRSLKSLKDTKEAFSKEAKDRQENFDKATELLRAKADELEALVHDVPLLKEHLNELAQEEELLAEILTLGFSANADIIKSGKGKKMAILLENAKLHKAEHCNEEWERLKAQNAPSVLLRNPPPPAGGGLEKKG